jgi:replicative DNA helicase
VDVERALPASLDAERLILGSILCDAEALGVTQAVLEDYRDFSLEKHRKIYNAMVAVAESGARVDRITVCDELIKRGQLESVDGLSYIVSLDDGLPEIYNLDGYAAIVREKAALRELVFFGDNLTQRAMGGMDSSREIVAAAEEQLLKSVGKREATGLVSAREVAERYEGGISAFMEPSKRQRGLPTGFVKLDNMTSGFHPGDMIIVAGRPSMGKTALALNIAHWVTCRPNIRQPVAVFSLEMPKEAVVTRMMCSHARVDMQKFRAGYLNKDERRKLSMALTDITQAPIHIDDGSNPTMAEIHAKLLGLQKEYDGELGLAVIDYLQLMRVAGKVENRNQEVSALSRSLKLMAKDLGVPILVLSQLSRAPESRGDRRPQLSDLRESGSLEQDADVVAFIYREEYYKPDREDLKGLAELIVGKQRNGPIGSVKLAFLKQFIKFENLATDLGSENLSLVPSEDDEVPM